MLKWGFTQTFGSFVSPLSTLSLGCLEIVALPRVDKGCLKLFRVYIYYIDIQNRLCETD